MDTKLTISGFKCFEDDKFILKDVTVLTGSNGAGKSSLIQAILLCRLAIELNVHQKREGDFCEFGEWCDNLIPLNEGYSLKLGTIYDIFREGNSNENVIRIRLDGELFQFEMSQSDTSLLVKYSIDDKNSDLPFWRRRQFYYLNTERLGPRHSLEIKSLNYLHCGFKGEFTAQVMLQLEHDIHFESPMTIDKRGFMMNVNQWLDTVCPGVLVSPANVGTMSAQIKVSGSAGKSNMLATNIGFGISYVLPIIVTGLIAQKGSVIIVENPEAHLHPKGQSNIGYFLGIVASKGVKVIIETHSEHVINGVRKAFLSTKKDSSYDSMIYFFDGFADGKIIKKEIYIDETGNLSSFPRNFFDQVNQDIAEVFKLNNKENG